MDKILIISFFTVFLLCIHGLYHKVYSQHVEVIKFNQLEKLFQEKNEPIEIFNFWATWCKPCIKELPLFEHVNQSYEEVSVTLVSFDFPDQIESRLIPFLKKRNIKSFVKVLNETDFNSFIDKIDPKWSGALPATLIFDNKNNKRYFFGEAFKEGELQTIIKQIINNKL